MNPEIVAAIVAAIGAVGAAVVAGIKMIFNKIERYLSELKPNGGNSIKDQITRLDKAHDAMNNEQKKLNIRLEALETKLDLLTEAFKNYIKGK
jgi:uncharacterized protein YsxB (DUF464 family)